MTEAKESKKAVDMSDFEEFMLEDTSVLDIVLPNEEPMLFKGQPVRVHLYGPSTEEYARAVDRKEKSAMKRVVEAAAAKNKVNKAMQKKEDVREVDVRFLIDVTSHFENFPYPGGKEGIYKESRFVYMQNQILRHLADMGNFFKGSEKT